MNDFLQNELTNEQLVRWLTPNSTSHTESIGCPQCPHHKLCGGLHVEGSFIDCHDLCCEDFDNCTLLCKRRSPREFVNQVREVGGFEFDDILASTSLHVDLPNGVFPFLRHKYCRSEILSSSLVSISLSDLIDFQTPKLRYTTNVELRNAFKLSPDTKIVVTGVDPDREIERWWCLGQEKRVSIIQSMKSLGIELVTAPNYSVMLDSPRMNDLHSFKRIALTCSEFIDAGIPCALHAHGRTNFDFERWGNYLRDHPEISVLAYEFKTGPGRADRLNFHIDQLCEVQKIAGRPLSIVVRGSLKCLPGLRDSFRKVTYFESNSFMKAIKRQEAYVLNRNTLHWRPITTEPGEPIDMILQNNVRTFKTFVENIYFEPAISSGIAA